MTVQEFSNEFDVEYNNIMSDMAPGLDAYEKSKFLTMAQEEIVIKLYNGTLDDGFESTELVRRYLANLIKTVSYTTQLITPTSINKIFKEYLFTLPDELLVIISERATLDDVCYADKLANVVPVTYDLLNIVLNNPFRRPNNRKVLRRDITTHKVNIISKTDLKTYTCEYLKKPSPIILETLPTTLSIDGSIIQSNGELDSALHRTIVKYAVQLAAASWASNNKK